MLEELYLAKKKKEEEQRRLEEEMKRVEEMRAVAASRLGGGPIPARPGTQSSVHTEASEAEGKDGKKAALVKEDHKAKGGKDKKENKAKGKAKEVDHEDEENAEESLSLEENKAQLMKEMQQLQANLEVLAELKEVDLFDAEGTPQNLRTSPKVYAKTILRSNRVYTIVSVQSKCLSALVLQLVPFFFIIWTPLFQCDVICDCLFSWTRFWCRSDADGFQYLTARGVGVGGYGSFFMHTRDKILALCLVVASDIDVFISLVLNQYNHVYGYLSHGSIWTAMRYPWRQFNGTVLSNR